MNYIGEVSKNEYLKYTCENKGKCCNINHIYKINSKKCIEIPKDNEKSLELNKDEKKESSEDSQEINLVKDKNDKNKLIIIF